MQSPSMTASSQTVSPMWRSNTSSGLTLVITLALIRHFSKPPQEASPVENGRGGQSRSRSKPKVDMVSGLCFLEDTRTHTPAIECTIFNDCCCCCCSNINSTSYLLILLRGRAHEHCSTGLWHVYNTAVEQSQSQSRTRR